MQTESKVLTVTELTSLIKGSLERGFSAIAVQGEVSNFKAQSSGHFYFSLKDGAAQIACVLFKGASSSLQRPIKEGDQLLVKGQLTVYPPRGSYQILIQEVEFVGVGKLLLELHRRKEALKAKGYFDESKKRKIPLFPKCIVVVTSPTGAVIQDILHILQRRIAGFHLVLYPVKVQGESAAEEIALAIREINQYQLGSVIIVGRGGGSIEDLWAFNELPVIEAIYHSTIPVVSAVGHETDFTLADLVADVRAPTPSAAAELVSKEREQLLLQLKEAHRQLYREVKQKISYFKQKLEGFIKHPALASKDYLLSTPLQRIDELSSRLDQGMKTLLQQRALLLLSYIRQKEALHPGSKLTEQKKGLSLLRKRLDEAIAFRVEAAKKAIPERLLDRLKGILEEKLQEKREQIQALVNHLHSINPKNLLQKGYTILFSEKDGSIILSSKQLSYQDRFYAELPDGRVSATVDTVILKES